MRELLTATVLAAAFALAIAADPQKPKSGVEEPPPVLGKNDKHDPVEGGYTVISGERDGQIIPPAELKDAVVRLTRGELIGIYKDLRHFLADTYTVDDTKNPWRIEMKSLIPPGARHRNRWPNNTTHGLIKKEGGIVTLIYALPGGPVPTDFKTKQGQQMFVLQSFATGTHPPNKFPLEP